MRVLVIKPSSIGDIIHALLIVERLKSERPDAEVHWIVRREFAGIIEAAEAVDHIYYFDRNMGQKGFVRLMAEVRQTRFDYVLEMQGLLRTAFMSLFAWGRHKIGRADSRELAFLGCSKLLFRPKRKDCLHAVRYLEPFLEPMGIVAEAASSIRFIKRDTGHLVPEGFGAGRKVVALFPESRRAEKIWPHFVELTNVLLDGGGPYAVLWLGAEPVGMDSEYASDSFLNLTGKTALNDLPALISLVDAVVCNDSGPMHLAAALGCRMVALFGPTDPSVFGPFPEDPIRQRVITSEDGKLGSIRVETVTSALESIFEEQAPEAKSKALVIWCFVDGKSGHEEQTRGLISALSRRLSVRHFSLSPLTNGKSIWAFISGNYASGRLLPRPDLIIGAGHRTHLAMLAARHVFGGKTVVLMKPSLPARFFDLCFIPKHDEPKLTNNVVETVGVLNSVLPSAVASMQRGLLLIGGPSQHFGWDDEQVVKQVIDVVRADRGISWILTTSRRTPESCEEKFVRLEEENLQVVPVSETETGWVAIQLEACKRVFVTEESISMVYEALTSGAIVGLIKLGAPNPSSRVGVSLDDLRERGLIVDDPKEVIEASDQPGSRPVISEADRCADALLEYFKI